MDRSLGFINSSRCLITAKGRATVGAWHFFSVRRSLIEDSESYLGFLFFL